MGADSIIILHFTGNRPILEELDLITNLVEASKQNFVLENNCSDVYFKINYAPGKVTSFKVKGLAGAKYTIFNNGQVVCASLVADKNGELEFTHRQVNECDSLYISMVEPDKEDLALNCEVVAETTESECYEAKNVVDGDYKTMWKSEVNELPHWIKVDLGSKKTIDRVDIHWHELENNEYRIQVSSDGYNWYAVAYILADQINGLKSHTFEPVNARYVRVVISNRNFTNVCIYSINVY